MASYTGIHHLSLATGDMEATIRFWRDLLGLRLVAGLGRPGWRQYFFELAPGALIAFFEWPGVEPLPERDPGAPASGPFAFDHLSIAVASEDDLWELKDRLDAAGQWVSEVVDHGFIRSIYAFDPNNVPLEIGVPLAGFELGERPRMLDSEPAAAAREGSEPRPGFWPATAKPTPARERRVYPGEGRELVSGAE